MQGTELKKLLKQHPNLVHSEQQKVNSHVQREEGDWWVNTVMIDKIDVPFKFKRKQPYRSLKGARVNLTYYPTHEEVAGIEFEYMKVVRIKVS